VSNTTDQLMIHGEIVGNGFGLTKVGAGTLVLNGTNSYTGPTTVNGGELLINGITKSSGITVNSGGAVGGSGTAGNVTINNGGILDAGANHFTVTNLVLAPAPLMDFTLSADPAASGQIIVNSALNISNMTTNWLTLRGIASANTNYTLLHTTTGGSSIAFGSFTNWTDFLGNPGWTAYLFTDGNDVILHVVPEPSAYALVGAGLLGLMALRRFRRI
jgi:autotransporter-associated beta strand protein